ncbi:unnamed protein product (macronuclear) [Paramecium tetraurelia]|uniref:Myb-like DNA-binding domain containing protein n=1 Tax=Paramecium tetraurelia TaxID=5888 RepID=A0E3Z8_PARTE|nr:uncharacterized protein GSPATT00023188001 [Paramecium tetraurelia]CAK90015.1 unnamed protein product [Paramecium tetraurelia]|eukprot:XP_001457412.1 hypothetical protein (macronuclear) [Paramecium tetraurelia strain d4-2]
MLPSDIIAPQRKAWTFEEDHQLQELRQSMGLDWIEVARQIGGRNPSQCAQRWKRIKGYKLRRQWTSEEDDKLKSLVKEYGYHWSRIAKLLPNRSGKQIREHYLNQLHPNLNTEPWSVEEDEQLLEIYKKIGGKWSAIQKKLNGRSENSIKNRFYSYLRSKHFGVKNPYYIVPEQVKITKTDQKQNKIDEIHSQDYSVQIYWNNTQQYMLPMSTNSYPSMSPVNNFPSFQIFYPVLTCPPPHYLLPYTSNVIQPC